MTPRLDRRDAWIASALFLGVFGVFAHTMGFDFVIMDDPLWVAGHELVGRGITADGVRYAFTSTPDGNYAPLVWLSHMLVVEIGGVGPAAHHAGNVLLHASCSALFFLFLRAATGGFLPSLFAAAFFAVHPLRVESVAWVTERKDVLSGVFWVLCMLSYLVYARRPSALRYALLASAFAMGLLAKSILVTLPCVLLLLDVWPLDRARLGSKGAGGRLSRLAAEKLPLFGMSAAAGVAAVLTQGNAGALATLDAVPVAQRLWNASASYAVYLVQTTFPCGLAPYYPLMPRSESQLWGVAGLAGLTSITAITLSGWRRRPYAVVGWLWFVGTLVPVIGLVQVGGQAHANRYTYIPHLGLFVAVVWTAAETAGRFPAAARWGRAFGAALVLGCAALTWRQAGYWRDSVSLFRHALEVTGPNDFSEGNLGVALIDESQFSEAEAHLRRAIELGPQAFRHYQNLGTALLKMGRVGEAAHWYEEAIERNSAHVPSWVLLGDARLSAGQGEAAAEAYRQSLRLGPENLATRTNLGIALGMAGRHDEAEQEFQRVIRADPAHVEALFNHGLLRMLRGDMSGAAERFEAVNTRAPSHALAHYYLAVVDTARGRTESAMAALMRAVQADAELRNLVRNDARFEPLRRIPEFVRLVQ